MGVRGKLDPNTTTVHEAIGLVPGAGAVFAEHGIDTCCGGDLPLAQAAEHHEVALQELLDALDRAGAGL